MSPQWALSRGHDARSALGRILLQVVGWLWAARGKGRGHLDTRGFKDPLPTGWALGSLVSFRPFFLTPCVF